MLNYLLKDLNDLKDPNDLKDLNSLKIPTTPKKLWKTLGKPCGKLLAYPQQQTKARGSEDIHRLVKYF